MKASSVGGVETVVKAIDTHSDDVGVCENGCGALWNMVGNGKNTDKQQNKTTKVNNETEQLRTK